MLIGVDAGGTRTTAAVADAGGRILARAEAGPGAIRPSRASAAAAAIYTATRDALQRARFSPPAAAMVVGASGAGQPTLRTELASALEGCGLATRLLIVTDAEIALEAAFGDGPGIALIAGTGSVAWARLQDGTTARAGGLGPVLGDRGSGYSLGREALRAIGAAMELEIGLDLGSRIARHLSIETDDLPRWSLAASVPQIALLAPVVLDAALEGDPVAQTIAAQEARHLAGLVSVLARKLPGSDVGVAWSGGLLAGRPEYRKMMLDCLALDLPDARIAADAVDAVAGAVAKARTLAGG